MNIGKAASKAGLSVKTVRYYSNIGMVAAYQDPQTGYREYSNDDVAKLQFHWQGAAI
jgi:DNA-binding transcriptional MerR regulator